MKERACHHSVIKALKSRLLRARDLGNAGVRHMSESVADIESAAKSAETSIAFPSQGKVARSAG